MVINNSLKIIRTAMRLVQSISLIIAISMPFTNYRLIGLLWADFVIILEIWFVTEKLQHS